MEWVQSAIESATAALATARIREEATEVALKQAMGEASDASQRVTELDDLVTLLRRVQDATPREEVPL